MELINQLPHCTYASYLSKNLMALQIAVGLRKL